jgi:endonuclease/exonuclease/phosphatase family metal-dependent hydrolase
MWPAHSQNTEAQQSIIKVMTFNIYHGETMNGDFDLDVIAKVIIEADPDFVALQEVDFKTNRAHKYDLATELGWRTKMIPLFGKAMKFDGGEYGEGILSKHSFAKTRNVRLPFTPGNEPRAALEAVAVLPSGDTIAFIGTHFDHLTDERDRIAQATKINEVFASNRYPSIFAGDLNALPGSKTIKILEELWTATYNKENPEGTIPSSNPTRKIDYVMFMPQKRWRTISTKVIVDPIASDHCAYMVTLELVN